MANLKAIKTNKGDFQFEALPQKAFCNNYFDVPENNEVISKLLKVLVLYSAYGKSELLNSIKPEDFVWLGDAEQVLYGIENN